MSTGRVTTSPSRPWPIRRSRAWSAISPISTAASSTSCSRATGSRIPSYSAIDCNAEGPITIGSIALSQGGEEIFKEQRSLIWKSLRVNRIYDRSTNSLIYLAHAREIQQGSGKMSLSVVPLNLAQVTWSNGAPAGVASAPAR